MNLRNLVQDTLRDLEDNQKKLSLILQRCLRIARLNNDLISSHWIKLELIDNTKQSQLKNLKDEISNEIISTANVESVDNIFNKLTKNINEYLDRRTVSYWNNNKLETGIQGLSIVEIENKIDMLRQQLQLNKLPDGLHQVDLYFENQNKQKVDLLFNNQIENLNNILERTKVKVYEYLSRLEDEVLRSDSDSTNLSKIISKNVFIIHGHDEARWRELEKLLRNEFGLNPIILQECPDRGNTIIENKGKKYLQARPNVIFELGWFYSFLGRRNVCILFQESGDHNIFSDLQGVIQKRFYSNIKELYRDIKLELQDVGII
jgi:predicted nucleotide-binding protein